MTGQLGRIAIRAVGTGRYGQGILQLYSEGGGTKSNTIQIGAIQQGVPYLISLRVTRVNESDIYSVLGLAVGAEQLSVLQKDASKLQYTANVSFPRPAAFSNPDSMESRNLVIGNGDIDLTWVHLYDYYLDTPGVAREVNNDWKYVRKYE